MTTTFTAPDIECAGCAASIQKALGRAPGVQSLAVDIDAKTVQIAFDEAQTSRDALAETLTEMGFPPSQESMP